MIQSLFTVIDTHLNNLQKEYSDSIEVVRRASGGFPLVYFLLSDVEQSLRERLVDDVCKGRTASLPAYNLPGIRLSLLDAQVPEFIIGQIVGALGPESRAMMILYLLRDLLVNEVMFLCLKKRWNGSIWAASTT